MLNNQFFNVKPWLLLLFLAILTGCGDDDKKTESNAQSNKSSKNTTQIEQLTEQQKQILLRKIEQLEKQGLAVAA